MRQEATMLQARRRQPINITFEGMDDIDDFGPMIQSPSGEVDAMEADFHSRGSISAVHELEVAACGSQMVG
jgi:hypothetical protein